MKGILDAASDGEVVFQSEHLASLGGAEGDYIIDVVATFSALGAKFVVIVECKHHARKVERQDVKVLNSKLRSVVAQKGMLFSVSGFQATAVQFAAAHVIALVEAAAGVSNLHTRSAGATGSPPSWLHTPKHTGWLCTESLCSLVSERHSKYLKEFLGLESTRE